MTALAHILLLAALAQGGLDPRRTAALQEREAFNSSLETWFNGECRRIKSGELKVAPMDLGAFALVQSCSLRALDLKPGQGKDAADALMLWEVDGFGPSGQRRTLRGEAKAHLVRTEGAWRFASFEPVYTQTQQRDAPAFREVPADAAGIRWPTLKPSDERWAFEVMRGGLGVFDVDSDGLLDLLVTAGKRARLYRNLGGFRFEETGFHLSPPKGALLSAPAAGDFDGDGDPDVVVTLASRRRGAALLFRNDGGKLVRAGQLKVRGLVAGAVPADFDLDGKLDLALVRYGHSVLDPDDFLEATNGNTLSLWKGKGDLTFRPLRPGKALRRKRWGLAAVAANLAGDGRPELYVANDFGSNDLWSWGPKGWTEAAERHGLRDPGNGMSADVGDVNGDGRLDLYVANMFSKAGTRVLGSVRLKDDLGGLLRKFAQGNTLYVAGEDGSFKEVARELGVNRGLWAFGSIFLDYDDDARLDLAVTNGFISNPGPGDL